MMLYICTKCHENIFEGFKSYTVDMIFILIISKGHKSTKNVNGFTVLVLPTSSNNALYLV